MKLTFKLLRILFWLFGFLGLQFLRKTLWWGKSKEALGLAVNSWFGFRIISAFGVEMNWLNEPGDLPHQFVLVGNHLSWVDPILVSTKIPAHFVTSHDVRKQIGIGWIARLSGCFFVSRRLSSLKRELDMMSESMGWKKRLGFYPEATTGDGRFMLPFKNALLEIAMQEELPIVPVCTSYLEVDGEKINSQNAHKVYYFGDMTMAQSLKNWLSCERVKISLESGPILHPKDYKNRSDLSIAIRSWLESRWKPYND